MAKIFYFGGQFMFRYKDYSIENIEKDYRSRVLGDYRLWLNENNDHCVKINDENYYVGPFYFTEEKSGHGILKESEEHRYQSCGRAADQKNPGQSRGI